MPTSGTANSTGSATVRDVAARAGVSLSTVSNVLNRPDRVAPATLRRVRQAIDEVGFVRNDAARALRLGESQAVGIVLSEATSPFYAEVARAASVRLAASGMSALIGSAGHDAATADRLTELFESHFTQSASGVSLIFRSGLFWINWHISARNLAALEFFCSP